MKKALFYVLVFLFVQLVTSFVFVSGLRLAGIDATTTVWTVTISAVASVVTVAVFAWMRWTPVTRSYLRSRPWAVLIWSAVAAFGAILPSMGLQDVLPELPNLVEDEMTGMLRSRWGYFALGLFAPVAEEFVFRGAVLRTLLNGNLRPWGAITVSALLFAVAHLNPAQLVHAFIIGLLLGWMYWRTGSIIPGIVYHWVNNSIAYAMMNLMPIAQTEHLSDLFGGDMLRMVLSIVFSLFILLPALYQLNQGMKRVG